MLHPDIAGRRNPISTWQMDTTDVDEVSTLYSRNLAGLQGSEAFSWRLGLLWKKLASSPRLIRCLWEFCELKQREVEATPPAERGRAVWRVERFLAMLGMSPRGPASGNVFTPPEFSPLYDPWLDG